MNETLNILIAAAAFAGAVWAGMSMVLMLRDVWRGRDE